MKNSILFAIVMSGLVLLCSCNSKKAAPAAEPDPEFVTALQSAQKSLVLESNLISGFKIGMTEEQVDSVIQSLYASNSLIHRDDVNEDMIPLRESWEYSVNTSCLEYNIQDKTYYISLNPIYAKGRLTELVCTITNAKGQNLDAPLHVIFSKFFEQSERGKSFKKFTNKDENGEEMIFFIKDNLEIVFFPQSPDETGEVKGTIQYDNIPGLDEIEEENKEKDQDLINSL